MKRLVPIIRGIAFLTAACDAVIAVRFCGRKRTAFAVMSILSCLTIAIITLAPTIF